MHVLAAPEDLSFRTPTGDAVAFLLRLQSRLQISRLTYLLCYLTSHDTNMSWWTELNLTGSYSLLSVEVR